MVRQMQGAKEERGFHRGAAPDNGIGRWLLVSRYAGYPLLAVCLAGLLWPALAADIRATPHNLSQNKRSVEADEVCVFCHTPQLPVGLDKAAGAAMHPAWQPSLKSHDFLMFDDIGRKQFGKMAVGSQSVACLSCHDSNQAFQITGVADHPFGVPYRGFMRQRGGSAKQAGDLFGKKGNSENKENPEERESTSRSASFLQFMDDFRLPSKGKSENRTIWWVSATGVSASRSRSDLPLYARQEEDGETPYIECSSCHDPHVVRPLFLRVSNEGSKLCLTCHDK